MNFGFTTTSRADLGYYVLLFDIINIMIFVEFVLLNNLFIEIREILFEFERKYSEKIKCIDNQGQKLCLTAMKHCSYMLGNTSTGIIEAGNFNVPVVNIRDRQKGRLSGKNVVHTGYDSKDILDAVRLAKSLKGTKFVNPYGNGDSARQIVDILTKKKN